MFHTRQQTIYFGNIRRFSVHSPLTKDTGENLDYRLHFSQLLYTKEKFSTIAYISRLSLTLSSIIVYISHILYAVLDYCLHFSIYFCPVWLAIILDLNNLYDNLNNSYIHQPDTSFTPLDLLRTNTKILHSLQNTNSNFLLFLEALHIKFKKPRLNSGLKASKELIVFP